MCQNDENDYLQIVNNMIKYLSTVDSGIGIYGELTPVFGVGANALAAQTEQRRC